MWLNLLRRGNDMAFDIFNFVICLIEVTSMLLFVKIIDDSSLNLKNYIISFCGLFFGSIVVTFIDNISYPILIINFLILFLSFWIGFRRKIIETLFNALFSFLLLLYFQNFSVIFIPMNFLGTNKGNFLGDSIIFIVALTLCVISCKYKWAYHYRKNVKIVWTLLGVLCVPEIIIVQYFTAKFSDSTRQTIIIMVLLQIIYITAIIAIFTIINHRSNYCRFLQTQKYIDDLDKHLDASRKSIHDFNKHIKYLHNLVMTSSRNSVLKNEVDGYCKNLINIYDDEEILLQLDEPIFRALLYGRRTQAEKNTIEFVLDATPILPKFPMENYKFVEIFDNLMDNAFECVINLDKGINKWIKVLLDYEQIDLVSYHKLTIYNPYEEINLSKIFNSKTYTSKGKLHMGVGLKKVAQLVEDTGGTFLISTDDNIFSVSIIYKDAIDKC